MNELDQEAYKAEQLIGQASKWENWWIKEKQVQMFIKM